MDPAVVANATRVVGYDDDKGLNLCGFACFSSLNKFLKE